MSLADLQRRERINLQLENIPNLDDLINLPIWPFHDTPTAWADPNLLYNPTLEELYTIIPARTPEDKQFYKTLQILHKFLTVYTGLARVPLVVHLPIIHKFINLANKDLFAHYVRFKNALNRLNEAEFTTMSTAQLVDHLYQYHRNLVADTNILQVNIMLIRCNIIPNYQLPYSDPTNPHRLYLAYMEDPSITYPESPPPYVHPILSEDAFSPTNILDSTPITERLSRPSASPGLSEDTRYTDLERERALRAIRMADGFRPADSLTTEMEETMEAVSVTSTTDGNVRPADSPTADLPFDWATYCPSPDPLGPTSENVPEEPSQQFVEQGCCKIGLEIEFWTNSSIPTPLRQKHRIVPEYYSNMYELNDFLAEFTNKKSIRKFFRDIQDKVQNLSKTDLAPYYPSFKTGAVQIDNSSLAFNGCHLHISLPTLAETREFYQYLVNYQLVETYKFANYPSARSIMSHHIWGNIRGSHYSYKQKRRFRPILFTNRNTIEMRIWDNEDILFKNRSDKLASFIIDTLKDFRKGVKPGCSWVNPLHKIQNVEDLNNIYPLLDKLLGKTPNYHTKQGNGILLPSKQLVSFHPSTIYDEAEDYEYDGYRLNLQRRP